MPLLPLALIGLLGCAPSIHPQYDAARARALADPGPPPADWVPDAVVQVSAPVVAEVVEAATRGQKVPAEPFSLGPARVVPRIRLRSLDVVRARRCEGGCVGLDAAFDGQIAWTVGPVQGSTPVAARGTLDAVLEVRQERGAFVVVAVPRRLRGLEVEIGDLDVSIGGLRRELRRRIEAEALSRLTPQPVARFPDDALPIRAARVSSEGTGIRIDLLTDAPEPGTARPRAAPAEGFAVALAEQSLLGLARAEAFRNGPVAYGVVPEPTALAFTADGFRLGLRLWRIEGGGWWRDYTVTGTARVAGGRLQLAPTSVVEGPRSPGAAVADPLAALAEGLILDTVEDAVNRSLPLSDTRKVGGVEARVVLGAIEPGGATIHGTGTVRIGAR